FKPALTDLAVSQLGPIGAEMTRLMADSAEIDRILKDGARRAEAIAQPIIAEVKEIVGFLAR
ncbi:MAG: tryptophan--tRNA ligase, partial [Pseudomonadota bacterium]|nr:tryptophan--tRNA ligase [Pseudomonadota bacterium]